MTEISFMLNMKTIDLVVFVIKRQYQQDDLQGYCTVNTANTAN
jgi:hypothetical protein